MIWREAEIYRRLFTIQRSARNLCKIRISEETNQKHRGWSFGSLRSQSLVVVISLCHLILYRHSRLYVRREQSTYGYPAWLDTAPWRGVVIAVKPHVTAERDSRAEARPWASPALLFTSAPSSSVCLSHFPPFSPHLLSSPLPSLSLSFFVFQKLYLVSLSCWSLTVFPTFPDFDPPLRQCHVAAKATLWLFFQIVNSFPFCNIKSRLNHWQPWKLMFCL